MSGENVEIVVVPPGNPAPEGAPGGADPTPLISLDDVRAIVAEMRAQDANAETLEILAALRAELAAHESASEARAVAMRAEIAELRAAVAALAVIEAEEIAEEEEEEIIEPPPVVADAVMIEAPEAIVAPVPEQTRPNKARFI